MSVADRLGTGASFHSAPRPNARSVRGRAKAIVQGDIPAYELIRIPLTDIAATPLNPRRDFGTDEQKTAFGESLRQAQLAACVAVTRTAYLTLWPDHDERIGNASYVLVNGERRYRSALHVGLDALDFVVRDDLAASREEFVNNLLTENLDRADFNVIERACGVQQLVEVCEAEHGSGARSRAAERLGRDRSWVTNQLALLRLPSEIQAMLSSGELPERDGRQLARHLKEHPQLDPAELLDHWKTAKAQEAAEKEEQRAILRAAREVKESAARQGEALLSADNNPRHSDQPEPTSGVLLSADNNTPGATQSVPNTAAERPPHEATTTTRSTGHSTDTAVLSADNTHPAEDATTTVPHQAGKPTAEPQPAATLVRQLGSSPAELAKTLAAGLDRESLLALVEELRTFL